jgi:hypothetical protein
MKKYYQFLKESSTEPQKINFGMLLTFRFDNNFEDMINYLNLYALGKRVVYVHFDREIWYNQKEKIPFVTKKFSRLGGDDGKSEILHLNLLPDGSGNPTGLIFLDPVDFSKKIKKIERPEIDPFEEEEWGWEEITETVIARTYEMSGPPPKNLWGTKAQFEMEMEKIGYTHTTLTKSTSMLICSKEELGTLKWQKAQRYGIPIFTYEEAYRRFAKKLQRIRNPEVDPFDEEDWGWEEVTESKLGAYKLTLNFNDIKNTYFDGDVNMFLNFMNKYGTKKIVTFIKNGDEYGNWTPIKYSISSQGYKVDMYGGQHGYPTALVFYEPIIVDGVDFFYKEDIKEEDIEWF